MNDVIKKVSIKNKHMDPTNLFNVFSRIEQFGVTYKST